MKYRDIMKLQNGGGVYYSSVANPFSSAVQQDMQRSSQSTASGKDASLISDSVMNKLMENGIPNDVRKFMDMLAEFEEEQAMGMGINRRKLYDLRAYANQIIQQSNYLNKAEEEAIKNGAWDEIAVDQRGYLFIPDEKGNIRKIAPNKFDASKHTALTIGELLQQRKENDQMVDRSDIATTVGNSIGMEKINAYIQDIIKAVGTTTSSADAYVDVASIVGQASAKRPNQAQLQAIQGLYNQLEELGPDAIFKQTELTSSKNIQEAFSYIMSVLPRNMRNQLEGSYVAMGGKFENSRDYTTSIIANALQAGNDTKYNYSIDYDASLNKAAGTKSGEEKLPEQKRNLTGLEQLIQGSLGKTTYPLVSRNNPNLSFTLHGTGMGWMPDANNNKLSTQPLSLALDQGLGGMIDYDHIYAGDQKISQAMLDQFIYNGREIVNVYVPTDGNGNINWGLLAQYQQLLNKFSQDSTITDQEKQLFLSEIGINGTVDDKGNFVGNDPRMERFLVVTGITSDQVLDEDENSFVEVMNKSDKDYWMKMIDRIYGQINKGVKGDGKIEFKKDWTDWGTDLMYTPIFMKIGRTARFDSGTISDHGPLVLTQTYAQQLAQDQTSQIYKPSTSLLSNE